MTGGVGVGGFLSVPLFTWGCGGSGSKPSSSSSPSWGEKREQHCELGVFCDQTVIIPPSVGGGVIVVILCVWEYLFLSRHQSAETQCWDRTSVRTYSKPKF